jgi:O-antigen/teichoic acid export membrane protein
MNIPNYFIEHYLGESALGYFVAMIYSLAPLSRLLDSIGQAATPRLAIYYVERRTSFIRLLIKLIVVAVVLGASGIFFTIVAGKWFLALLYGEDYAKYSYVLVWLFVAGTVSYIFSMFDKAIVAAQHFRLRFLVIVLGTITMALSCYLLVPRFGLTGGATAKIAAAISMSACGILVICWSLLRQPLVCSSKR